MASILACDFAPEFVKKIDRVLTSLSKNFAGVLPLRTETARLKGVIMTIHTSSGASNSTARRRVSTAAGQRAHRLPGVSSKVNAGAVARAGVGWDAKTLWSRVGLTGSLRCGHSMELAGTNPRSGYAGCFWGATRARRMARDAGTPNAVGKGVALSYHNARRSGGGARLTPLRRRHRQPH